MELQVCVLCRSTTPERYYGCESPCARYREEISVKAADQVVKESKNSAELLKLNQEREELRQDDC